MPKLVKPLDTNLNNTEMDDTASVQVKVPKRILHFCDGTLEEYSDDELEQADVKQPEPVVDPKTLSWGPWTTHMAWAAGSSALAGCDYVGEWLASALGITTPKYYFEIEEQKKREAEKKKLEDASRGWSENAQDGVELVTKDVPSSNPKENQASTSETETSTAN